MRNELTRRLALFGIALIELLLAVCALVLAILLIVGLSLLVVGWGIPIVIAVFGAARPLAQLQRRCAAHVLARPVDAPYLTRTDTRMLDRLRGLLGDPAHRRDGYWLLFHGTVGLALSIVAVVVAAFGLVLWSGPPVLADRGLVGAVHALALQTPVPAYVSAQVPAALPAPLETAAYFALAEAITNAVKHAGATRIDIELVHARNRLDLTVRDNGRGGAVAWPGGGLDGIGRRLGAFDGTVAVDSPPGGPTAVHMVLPCASSSPKTSPSSVTD